MPHAFEQELYDRFAQSFQSWDTELYPDIYVLSLFLVDFANRDAQGNEVEMQREVKLSYNTVTHFEGEVARGCQPMHAKWNVAHWVGYSVAQMPSDFDYETDQPLADLALRDDWCASLAIPVRSRDEGGRPIYGEPFNEEMFLLCTRVVRALHDNGVIANKFGMPVPVLIEEHDSQRRNAVATRDANPSRLTEDVEMWLQRSWSL